MNAIVTNGVLEWIFLHAPNCALHLPCLAVYSSPCTHVQPYLADWMEISKSNSNGIVAALRYQSDF